MKSGSESATYTVSLAKNTNDRDHLYRKFLHIFSFTFYILRKKIKIYIYLYASAVLLDKKNVSSNGNRVFFVREKKDIIRFKIKDLTSNLFNYQAREPSLFLAGFLTAQFLQKKKEFMKPLL